MECDRVARILTYSYNWLDTSLNAAVLALQTTTLIYATSQSEVSLTSLFW